MPLDPSRDWLAAGITGIPRLREWDAVATVDAPGNPGDEAEFLALPDGRLVVESGPSGFDPSALAAALVRSLDPPYRALARRRSGLWAVGARSLDVRRLDPAPDGDEIEVVQDGGAIAIRVDGMPSTRAVPELERIGDARSGTYVVRARRLDGALFEVEVEPL